VVVLSLGSLIDAGYRAAFIKSAAEFTCKDKDVETFLRQKALEHERRNKSRTYLITDGNGSIIAYYTLAMKILTFASSVSKARIKNLDGFSKDVTATPALLIGQFGKDERKARDIPGSALMEMCLNTAHLIHTLVGGRFTLIECLDIEKVVSFYERHGFSVLQRDPRDKYLQLVRPFKERTSSL
jgi:hypothetical protein